MSKIVKIRELLVDADGTLLRGELRIPDAARGLILFAHGSGSGRSSPRNRAVARILNDAGLATLLVDLLTPEEELIDRKTCELRFDIRLLGDRLRGCIDGLRRVAFGADFPLGLFGASTGAAGALVAAAERPKSVFAVVSRGGRPDLAGHFLPLVAAPTLMIVGGEDREVMGLNRGAAVRMRAPWRIEIVRGASHLFQEPGTLEEAARLAADWFTSRLPRRVEARAEAPARR